MTDNSSVDAAASWVLDNQELPDLDEPFKVCVSSQFNIDEGEGLTLETPAILSFHIHQKFSWARIFFFLY